MSKEESFKEFYNKQLECDQYALSYDSRDMQTIKRHFEKSKDCMIQAWNHQQKKIQELENLLKEGCEVVSHYDYPDVGLEGNSIIKSGCVAHDFLNKPEILKLIGE